MSDTYLDGLLLLPLDLDDLLHKASMTCCLKRGWPAATALDGLLAMYLLDADGLLP